MTILPSPIPHPLDYSPWDLPGWIYEALEWVIGVEWPEGNEKAVWDLADQWFSVAATFAGPRDDVIAAANEVRAAYGHTGVVYTAFETAWRKVAEGDEAPLYALATISHEMGRLVQECGCDIEAAKIEVWIQLGILVVELLALAVAVALTAGAASPAAAAAMAATRAVIQQIFKRLIGQLARKSLRHGLKEAGEKAARQLAEGGMKGLAARAGVEGLKEAGEEVGIDLAIQGYQNSTGRRDGLDLDSVGRSALGGFVGGAGASLAGLGPHAMGRRAQIAEGLGRSMAGEVLADNLASLATGGGLTSFEDSARAATSGLSASAVSQSDAALHTKLDGRLDALAGTPSVPADLPGRAPAEAGTPVGPSSPVVAGTPSVAESADEARLIGEEPSGERTRPVQPEWAADRSALVPENSPEASPHPGRGGPADLPATAPASVVNHPASAEHPDAVPAPTLSLNGLGPADVDSVTPATDTGGSPEPTARGSSGIGLSAAPTSLTSPISGSAVLPVTPVPSDPSVPAVGSQPDTRTVSLTGTGSALPGAPLPPPNPRFPLLEALGNGTPTPNPQPATADATGPDQVGPPAPRTPEWYDIRRVANREGVDRRRYRGYLRAERQRYEVNRRADEAERLRVLAEQGEQRGREAIIRGRVLDADGETDLADRWFQISRRELRTAYALQDLAEAVLAGSVVPDVVEIDDDGDFARINDDAGDLVDGPVRTGNRSALTGSDDPPPIERSRRYGERGGLRRPLALHQTDLERHIPLDPDGNPVRTPDPRQGSWFRLANDGGPRADPARSINCLDCTLSLYETWVHGRPRVSAPRTFDGYWNGDVRQPVDGEAGGPARVEEITGGVFQQLCPLDDNLSAVAARQAVGRGFADLRDKLLAEGHGSYAFLVTTWEQGGSHAWVALNQGGTVLYLDPQSGQVRADLPLYGHRGVPHGGNVTSIDALVLGADGRPAPLADRPPGGFSARREQTEETTDGYDETYVNRIDLLDGPVSGRTVGGTLPSRLPGVPGRDGT
ncbi:toxin glutamine deamidase domain-containing protein [Micromonospora sp. CPCC 206060]|uniref:toxin glutamine deamidase domain-containing protein n=1 Tax=Micromonospora sp. CPCC 206060 TaxID=3122406 RepID=UPI002FF39408